MIRVGMKKKEEKTSMRKEKRRGKKKERLCARFHTKDGAETYTADVSTAAVAAVVLSSSSSSISDPTESAINPD